MLIRRSHGTQAQSTASHCRQISPTGECSRIHSKVSSDWLPSYIKTTQTVLEIFKKAGYFPGRPRTYGMILTVHAHIASLSSINESWEGTKK